MSGWSRLPGDMARVADRRRAHDALRSDPPPGTYTWQDRDDGPVYRITVPTRWLPYMATTRRGSTRRKCHIVRSVQVWWPWYTPDPGPSLHVKGWCGITIYDPHMLDTPDLGDPCQGCIEKCPA